LHRHRQRQFFPLTAARYLWSSVTSDPNRRRRGTPEIDRQNINFQEFIHEETSRDGSDAAGVRFCGLCRGAGRRGQGCHVVLRRNGGLLRHSSALLPLRE